MKKTLIISSILTVAMTCLGQANTSTETPQQRKQLTPEERAERMAKRDKAIMRVKGGFISKPGSQQGKIVFLNAQKRIPEKLIADVAQNFKTTMLLNIETRSGSCDCRDVTKLTGYVSQQAAEAVLFIVDDPAVPNLLSAPENRWTVANIASLADEKQPVFERRARVELIRGFGILAGGCNSQYENSVMRPVTNLKDLDAIQIETFPIDVTQRIEHNLSAFGITPLYRTTYNHAVREGWAPLPTNEFQQAVWDRERSSKERGPTNGLKIAPPKKK